MTFAELAAHPSLARALAEKEYESPTPVQAAVLAPEVGTADLLVSAQTGSGKTVAFGLALAPTLLGDQEKLPRARAPLALVIAPTRELALQVQRELQWLYGPAGARIASCVGGMEMRRELQALSAGAHIVVGTPGRLCDHLERHSLDLSSLRALVLDEADEMLDMGFRDELERILKDAPVERRTLMFSATIPKGIAELAARFQKDAKRLAVNPPTEAHRDIEYRVHVIAMREREHGVVNVLREAEAAGAIVFVSTRDAVNHLTANLVERGFQAVAISGELTQPERTRALKALRDGRARVLVATDVAARGLDLPDVGLVVHADLPHDGQVLQHRSGRTGRAGKKGVSVLLVPPGLRRAAERLLREARVRPEWRPVPTAENIHLLDEERLVKDALALADDVADEDRQVVAKLLAQKPAEELVAILASTLRSRRPAAEDLPLTRNAMLEVQKPRFEQRERPMTAALPMPSRPPSTPSTPMEPRHGVSGSSRPPTPPTEQRHVPTGQSAWFILNVGREQNADPKWLIPLLCRRGEVTKNEIGAIRIFPNETRFEIAPHAADRFAQLSRRPDKQDARIRISPGSAPTTRAPPFAPKRPFPGRGPKLR